MRVTMWLGCKKALEEGKERNWMKGKNGAESTRESHHVSRTVEQQIEFSQRRHLMDIFNRLKSYHVPLRRRYEELPAKTQTPIHF